MEIIDLHEEFPFHESTKRADGIHVSDIIQRVMEDIAGKKQPDDPDKQKLFELGLLWEDVLSMAFGDRLAERPEEMFCEGVYGNPDGVIDIIQSPYSIEHAELESAIVQNLEVEEYKWTFSKAPIEDMGRWHMQAKSYCYMCKVNTCTFRVARAQAYPPWIREYEVKRITYSDQEIMENWQLMQSYKDILLKEQEEATK